MSLAGRRAAPGAVIIAVVGATLLLMPPTALAAPSNPSDADIADAQSAQQAAAAEVGRIAGLVAAADAELQRVTLEAQAAADAHLVAQAELDRARAAAASAASELAAARLAVGDARAQVADLGRESYMRGQLLSELAALLDADGPSDMLQQAATLELLGEQRTATLVRLQLAQVRQSNADSAARATLAQVGEAEQAAAQTRAEAEARMATSQTAVDAASAQKAEYDQQLQDAQVELLRLQGARDAYDVWRREQDARAAAEAAEAAAAARAAAEAAAHARDAAPPGNAGPGNGNGNGNGNGTAVAPTSGRFTTCYEMRWGTMHYGVDIAAPIGTPIYSPLAGRVLRAGPATGFGLAVYVEHDDGSVTVYGHINDFFVTAGQRVTAGQVIAEVGNRGQSTGPHLHFEVHTAGMYQGRTNPIPWLAARGVDMGGRCR